MLSVIFDLLFFGPAVYLVIIAVAATVLGKRQDSEDLRPGQLLYRYAANYFATVAFVLISLFLWPTRKLLLKTNLIPHKKPVDEGEYPVVILVHGYMATPAHWVAYRFFLGRQGLNDVIAFGYPTFKGEISDWAENLKALIEKYPRRGVLLIGHSLGGLVSVRAADGITGIKVSVVTLASPLAGTEMARIAVTPNARKLLPGSADINDIIEILNRGKLDLTCYWSPFDNIIVPSASAAPTVGRCIKLDGVSHAGFFFRNIDFREIIGKK